LEGQRDAAGARLAFERAATLSLEPRRRRPSQEPDGSPRLNAQSYFQGLALRKLGREAEAQARFASLVQPQNAEPAPASRLATAEIAYLAGLGYLGQGKQTEAQSHFQRALEMHPAHVGARSALRIAQ
jgi:tetratricopeptide (TPR) repeat protein